VKVAASVAALLLAACGGDGESAVTDTAIVDTVAADTNTATDTSADAETDTTAADTGEAANACAPNPCSGRTPHCAPSADMLLSGVGGASCVVTSGGEPQCRWADELATLCDHDAVCLGAPGTAECRPPAEACEYRFARAATLVTRIALASQGDDDAGAFDYTGDGVVDNAVGELIAEFSGPAYFDADVNGELVELVETAGSSFLLEYRRAEDDEPGVDVSWLFGVDEDGVWSNNLLGVSRFAVERGAFDGALPAARFIDGTLVNGTLRGQAPSFELRVPYGTEVFGGPLREVRVEAQTTLGDNGRGLSFTGAKLGALVPMSTLVSVVNDSVTSRCACADFAGGGLVGGESPSFACNTAADASACTDEADGFCETLVDACPLALALITPDVDDALSLGLFIDGVSVTLDGLEPACD